MRGDTISSGHWIIDNLNSSLETWNDKLSEIWTLLTTSPETVSYTHLDVYKRQLQVWAEAMTIYRSGHYSMKFSKSIQRQLVEVQKDFMPEDTDCLLYTSRCV